MKRPRELLLLLPALVVLALLANHLDFYQDDAYISYRYVANYLNGDGLVFNVGEHVEGYTNFGWIVYLLCWGVLGLNYILASKITGLIIGAIVVVVTYLIARLVFDDRHKWFAVGAAYLVGFNQSLAYWSPAGLETAAFTLCAMLSLYFYMRRNWLLICSLTWAVLLRPEGALIAGLLVVIEIIQTRKMPFFSLVSALVSLVLLLPFVGFKIAYYGGILPNPFYAKTSFDMAQLTNGLEYAGRFLAHYGFFGVGFVVPLVWWKRISSPARTVWFYTVLYLIYVVFIGGDVLKVHRFFLPLFGPSAILILLSARLIIPAMRLRWQQLVLLVVMIPLLGLTYLLPRNFVNSYNFQEKAFTRKQQFRARALIAADQSDFTVGLATIGIFGFELIGHDIIDMLGLTDTTIARYSEEPIPGMQSTWKEQKHNSRYLLEREPDYILYSTGLKPSAPAEKALLLYPQFQRSYRSIAWVYNNPEISSQGVRSSAFKKVRPLEGEIRPSYPVEYAENFTLGLAAHARGDEQAALRYYNRAVAVSPKPYYVSLLYQMAYSHMMLKHDKLVGPMLDAVLAQDSMVYEAHQDLYIFYAMKGDRERSQIHRRWLEKLVPWYLPTLDSLIGK